MDARLEPYRVVVSFLGEALGPDYEVVLHDLTSEDGTIVAIVNNHISGRTEGAPLSNMALRFIQERMYEKQDYLAGYQGASQAKGRLRSSTMFIKDNGQLIGMLCINFDAGKYSRIAQELLVARAHPPTGRIELPPFSPEQTGHAQKVGTAAVGEQPGEAILPLRRVVDPRKRRVVRADKQRFKLLLREHGAHPRDQTLVVQRDIHRRALTINWPQDIVFALCSADLHLLNPHDAAHALRAVAYLIADLVHAPCSFLLFFIA